MLWTLKQARSIRGYTQLDIMLLTGLHQTTLSLFERGYRQPSTEEKALLARALKLAPEDIVFQPRKVKRLSMPDGQGANLSRT
jgi:transcriptional regulator with XRE-family HTH domain